MEVIGTDLEVKKGEKGQTDYYCEICDFKCCKKGDYNRHVLTSKHKKLAKINNLSTKHIVHLILKNISKQQKRNRLKINLL